MTMADVHANDPRWRPQAKLVRSSSPTKIDALDRHDSKTSTESVPGVAKCFGILVPIISTLYLSTNPGGTFIPVISTLYLSTNPGRIRFYCTGSGGPHWKVPVHIGGSLYSGQSNVMTFSLSPVLNWRYNSKQGDRDFVSTIKLGYRENVSSSVWLTFRSPSLVTFRFPSLVNQSNVSKNNVNQSVSLFEKSA